MPFKSEPQLAAVAEVFGTLSVDVSEMWIKSAEISRALLATYEKIQDEIFHIMQI
jgi:hypothetical protein